MPAGLQVWGDHGVLQITDSWWNLQFVGRLNFSIDANGYIVFQCVANTPFVFYRTYNEIVEVSASKDAGNVWTFRAWSVTGLTGDLVLYLFDSVPPVTGNAGLDIFRADGTLAFSSSYRQLRIAGIYDTAAGIPARNETATQIALPGGAREYAARLTFVRPGWYDAPFNASNHTEQKVADAISLTNNPSDQRLFHGAYDWGPVTVAGGAVGGPTYNFLAGARQPQIIVADVTGL